MWGAGGVGVIRATHLLCPLEVWNSDTMEVCLLSLTPSGGRGQLGWVAIMILNKHIRIFIPKWSDLSQWANISVFIFGECFQNSLFLTNLINYPANLTPSVGTKWCPISKTQTHLQSTNNYLVINIFGVSLIGPWICLQCGRPGFDPWVGTIPWRRERLPTPVFWPREFHGLYSPSGRKESDTTEWLSLSNILKHYTEYASKFGKVSRGQRTGKVTFHSNTKEGQCQRMSQLPYNVTC